MSASKPVFVINGPNLNLLGTRKPEVYGPATLADVAASCDALAADLGLSCSHHQSNHEGVLVELVHRAKQEASAIIINAGAYSHTSLALHDALEMFEAPIVEVHISNIHAREAFRHHSYISRVATGGIIIGCGVQGYEMALTRVAALLNA